MESFFCTSQRSGGPASRRFYKTQHAARAAMLRAIRNGAAWAEYGTGRHCGVCEFSVVAVLDRVEVAQ